MSQHPTEPSFDQTCPERRVLQHQRQGLRRRTRIPGRDQHRRIARQILDTTNSRGDDRYTTCERLQQHLGHPLRPRDVKEDMAGGIDVQQPVLDAHVTAKLGPVGHAKLLETRSKLVCEGTLTTNDKTDRMPIASKPREHVGEQKRILLWVQACDS